MAGLVYDTGMLVGLDRNSKHPWYLHTWGLAAGGIPVVPAMVLAQGWRGGPQHNLSRALRSCKVMPVSEQLARAAGALCGRAGTADTVDALVVVVADLLVADIVTSDVDDLAFLTEIHGTKVAVHRV